MVKSRMESFLNILIMSSYENTSCLHCPHTPKSLSCSTPKLVIYPSLFRCSSFVGRIGGKQEITVGNKKHRCKLGNIIHEIGHAVGFFHEQSRPDRDDFVKIVKENIKEGKTAFHFMLGVGVHEKIFLEWSF